MASTAKWIFSLSVCRNYIYAPSNEFYAAHFFTCLKLSSNASLLPLYQRVPYQMVHYWPFWWFASLSVIGSWIVVILVNRIMGQIIGLASVGFTSHKASSDPLFRQTKRDSCWIYQPNPHKGEGAAWPVNKWSFS